MSSNYSLIVLLSREDFHSDRFSTLLALRATLFRTGRDSMTDALRVQSFENFLRIMFTRLSLTNEAFEELMVRMAIGFFIRSRVMFVDSSGVFIFCSGGVYSGV